MTDTSYRKHLPLRTEERFPWSIQTKDGRELSADPHATLEEDAILTAFLVRAANCHDDLVETLGEIVVWYDRINPLRTVDPHNPDCQCNRCTMDSAKALLAKAKGEQP